MKKRSLVLTNIIGFIVGTFIFGIAGVYAVTYFSSTNTTYDNSSNGMSSTNVQTAIDELYNVCKLTPAEQIIKDNNLQKDPDECRYFFTGANPNNYITFNNETAGWRIISIECDNTIKIMKDASIGRTEWDESNSNSWNRPASLNNYLNSTYLNGLNSEAQKQIVAKDFGIGAVNGNVNGTHYDDLGAQVRSENKSKWNGKIALPTLSEYFRTNSRANCKTLGSFNLNSSSCKNGTWMYIKDDWWTLSPHYGDSNTVYFVSDSGSVDFYEANNSGYTHFMARPVLYLSSDLNLSGSGTQSDPYTIQ